MRIDLHSHSAASDGTQPPADVVRRAVAAGLDVLALTDHDTTGGIEAAAEALDGHLTLVPGMELSCRRDGMSIHLLVYLADHDEPALAAECVRIREARDDRASAMVAHLAELGVPITMELVAAVADGGVVGRPHIARVLADLGVVARPADAFTAEWIGTGGRAHVRRHAPDPAHAVRLARAAGGVAVLAHPKAARRGRVVPDEWIAELAGAGLSGVEADHPDHDEEERAHLRGLAGDLGLVATGASDDHGDLTGHRLGCETTSPIAYEELLAGATGAAPIR
ncbi:PHP domain-containing protein [Nonomuraea sp. NPDC046570]|uniref:PHP domain-containing protein n=1 Tax=Nonomuraea sp. NPDC046570 TaxID=3155255 RepID=UPI0033DC695D